LLQFRFGRFDQPALQVFLDQVGQSVHPVIAVVEAGNVMIFAPACVLEGFTAFLRNFFEGLQAVGNEARADPVP
jgi:hypothetical protein